MNMVGFSFPFLQMQYLKFLDGVSVRLVDPNNNDAKMKLAEIYEIMGEPRKALDLVYEGNQIFNSPIFFFFFLNNRSDRLSQETWKTKCRKPD
jgi:hypothetical protein